ncbi:MAG: hypothetical protein OEQ29_08885 [Alphaproteobacteria bacterium]|nr:hypothetical protein [Alphaproteobacteria bacterium]
MQNLNRHRILRAKFNACELQEALVAAFWLDQYGNTEHHLDEAHSAFEHIAEALGYEVRPAGESWKEPSPLRTGIGDCIKAKVGDKEFALFYFPDKIDGGKWQAAIGNKCKFVSIGESEAEFWGEGAEPEEAVLALWNNITPPSPSKK